jgi:protein-disulfide isomerase
MFRFTATNAIVLLLMCVAIAQQNSTAGKKSTNKVLSGPKSQTSGSLPSEATVNEFMKHTFGYDQSITWKIQSIKPSHDPRLAEVTLLMSNPQGQQVTTFFVTPDEHFAMVGEMIPFGPDPFAPARNHLQRGINGPSRGPMNAPVLLVEFSDLQCPHCKSAQPTIDRLLSAAPNARFVFQNYPLPSHNWAFKAASYADCVAKENGDAFWKVLKAVYDSQENITEANADAKLTELANASGVDGKATATCADRSDTKLRVEQSVQLGKEVDVTGTPTLFINGRKIANVAGTPFETLKGIVDYEAKQGK